MLKKMLKYDLKDIFKGLIVFYSLSLFFAILTRMFFNIENSFIMNIIAQICSGVTISMMFNILINNLMRMWGRFKQNLYGDESYLTHTLPLDKKTIYLSKTLTSLITLFTSIGVIGLTLFVAYYSKENLEFLKNLLLPIADTYNSTILNVLLAFLFVFFLEIVNTLQSGFTGIILGHKINSSKTLYSILFGFGVYICLQVVVLLLTFIAALFNPDLMNLFITSDILNVGILKFVICLAIIIYALTFIVGYFINVKLFSEGVDVE